MYALLRVVYLSPSAGLTGKGTFLRVATLSRHAASHNLGSRDLYQVELAVYQNPTQWIVEC